MARAIDAEEKEKSCFAERLCSLMKERKIKVSDFADFIGRKRQTIYNYRTGHTEPYTTDIIRIAKYFGVTTDYLLGNDEQPTIEAEPVKHGKWEEGSTSIRTKCSNCKKEYFNTTILEIRKSNYCPNCGARMDGE